MNADAKGEARTPEILYGQKTSCVKKHWISSAPSSSSADRASFESDLVMFHQEKLVSLRGPAPL